MDRKELLEELRAPGDDELWGVDWGAVLHVVGGDQYKLEEWFECLADPALAAAGVAAAAQTIVNDDQDRVSNRILFRAGGTTAGVTCVPTAVGTLEAGDVAGAVEQAVSTEAGHPGAAVALPPREHFLALRSLVAGWCELGWGTMLRARYEDREPDQLPFGMNAFLSQQVVRAIAAVAPAAARALVAGVLEDVLAQAEEWRAPRWDLYARAYSLGSLLAALPPDPAFEDLVVGAFGAPAAYYLIHNGAGGRGGALLARFAGRLDAPTRALLAATTEDEEVLARLYADEPGVRAAALQNPHLGADLVAQVAASEDPKERALAARAPAAPPGVLLALAGDASFAVRSALRHRGQLPGAVIDRLAATGVAQGDWDLDDVPSSSRQWVSDDTVLQILLGPDLSGNPRGLNQRDAYGDDIPQSGGGYVGRVKRSNEDPTTTFRALRPFDPEMGGQQADYSTLFVQGEWAQVCGTTAISPRTVPPGRGVLHFGWLCACDLGGGALEAWVNNILRSSVPAAQVFGHPAHQQLYLSELAWAAQGDSIHWRVRNGRGADIRGVAFPLAVVVAPAAQLGFDTGWR